MNSRARGRSGRSRWLLILLGLILALGPPLLGVIPASAGLSAPPGSGAAPPVKARAPVGPAYDPALTVTIDSLKPSYVPSSGVVRVTGEVTNVDDVDWVAINVYSVLGDAPMTTAAQLTEAAQSPAAADVGDRIITTGTADDIDRIEPGQSAPFSLTVPRSELEVTGAGVYWFAVHAIGESENRLRDAEADGRARTFIPYLPEGTPGSIKTALVIPLRRYLDYAPNGSLADPQGWGRTLANGGRLRDALDFGAAAGDRPVSWLVDPALPDAVSHLSTGNGGRSLAPTQEPPDQVLPEGATEQGEPSDAASPPAAPQSKSPSSDPGAEETDPADLSPALAETAQAARSWLGRLGQALKDSEVLALPYGDLDVAAAAEIDPEAYQRARSLPGSVLPSLGLDLTPAVGAPAGYLNEAGFDLVTDDTTVLVTDEMFGAEPPGVAEVSGHRIAVTSSGVADGGPGPGRRLDPVNLRQRLLSQAAVSLLNPGRRPLVVVLPPKWRPAGGTDFFNGLDVDWLELTTVAEATDRSGGRRDFEELDYPGFQDRLELNQANFEAVASLTEAGAALQELLLRNSRVGTAVAEQALATASYGARQLPVRSRAAARLSRDWIDRRMGSVEITSPSGVTLAGDSGDFGATVENGLDQPVVVDLLPETDDGAITIEPIAPVRIAPGARTSLNLTATSTDVGVHNVRLVLTDRAGRPLGGHAEVTIRSAQVSGVIWLIIGSGVGLLFLAIIVRLIRRVRGEPEAEQGPIA